MMQMMVLAMMFIPKRKKVKITRKSMKRSAEESFNQRGRKSSIGLFIKKKQTKCTAPLVGK